MSDPHAEIDRFRELLRRDPRSRVFAPLAEACRREGLLEEAVAVASAGVAQHPAYAGGRLALSRALLDLGRLREAEEELERAAAASPGVAIAYRLLGEARGRLGDRRGAFEAFARALALDPSDTLARRGVLDLDALMKCWEPPPPVVGTGAEVEQEELDLSLEAVAAGETEPIAGMRPFDQDTGPEEESELPILLVPEDSPAGGEEEASRGGFAATEVTSAAAGEFQARRLDVLDIVHSSLAPEAAETPQAAWELPGDDADALSDAVAGALREEAEAELNGPDALPPDLRTETLADLYVQQGHVERAREIYQAILAAKPLHLRVRKKMLDLPAPVTSPFGESRPERKIAALKGWLDRVRTAGDRTRSGAPGRISGIGNSSGIVTAPPRDEGQ